jgi:hypothetical protein
VCWSDRAFGRAAACVDPVLDIYRTDKLLISNYPSKCPSIDPDQLGSLASL